VKPINHIKIPEGAEDDVWKSIPDHQEWQVPGSFFEGQQANILAKTELATPEGYFEKSAANILNQTIGNSSSNSNKKGRERWLPWISIAAAAGVVGAILVLFPKEQQVTFAELFHQSNLTDDEIIETVEEEDIMEVFPEEIASMNDTIIDQIPTDSTAVGLDSLKNPIKPIHKKALPKWDEISTEEIIEYLMENGDEDLFN